MSRYGAVASLFLAITLSQGLPVLADGWCQVTNEADLGFGQRRQLAQDKILVTDDTCLQIFEPYVEPEVSVFITSDSILNAYHVLLEESVLQLEQANAGELREILEFVWKNLDSAGRGMQGDEALTEAARS